MSTPVAVQPLELAWALYTYGEPSDVYRICDGQRGTGELAESEYYGKDVDYFLLQLGMRGTADIDEKANDDFLWCGVAAEVTPQMSLADLPDPAVMYQGSGYSYVLAIRPSTLDCVYVIDQSAYDHTRAQLAEGMAREGRDRFNDVEVVEMWRARARTLMAVGEYSAMVSADATQTYESPLALIDRRLSLDEVEVVSGPWPHMAYVYVMMQDEIYGLLQQLVGYILRNEQNRANPPHSRGAIDSLYDSLLAYCDANADMFEGLPRMVGSNSLSRIVSSALDAARFGLLKV